MPKCEECIYLNDMGVCVNYQSAGYKEIMVGCEACELFEEEV